MWVHVALDVYARARHGHGHGIRLGQSAHGRTLFQKCGPIWLVRNQAFRQLCLFLGQLSYFGSTFAFWLSIWDPCAASDPVVYDALHTSSMYCIINSLYECTVSPMRCIINALYHQWTVSSMYSVIHVLYSTCTVSPVYWITSVLDHQCTGSPVYCITSVLDHSCTVSSMYCIVLGSLVQRILRQDPSLGDALVSIRTQKRLATSQSRDALRAEVTMITATLGVWQFTANWTGQLPEACLWHETGMCRLTLSKNVAPLKGMQLWVANWPKCVFLFSMKMWNWSSWNCFFLFATDPVMLDTSAPGYLDRMPREGSTVHCPFVSNPPAVVTWSMNRSSHGCDVKGVNQCDLCGDEQGQHCPYSRNSTTQQCRTAVNSSCFSRKPDDSVSILYGCIGCLQCTASNTVMGKQTVQTFTFKLTAYG